MSKTHVFKVRNEQGLPILRWYRFYLDDIEIEKVRSVKIDLSTSQPSIVTVELIANVEGDFPVAGATDESDDQVNILKDLLS